jgi:hypothetical protein
MTGFEIFKFSLLILIVLGAQAVLIWYQSTLLRIHVNVSNFRMYDKNIHRLLKAPDPDWRDFPFKCAENSQNLTILNCVSWQLISVGKIQITSRAGESWAWRSESVHEQRLRPVSHRSNLQRHVERCDCDVCGRNSHWIGL